MKRKQWIVYVFFDNWRSKLTNKSMHIKSKSISKDLYYVYAPIAELVKPRPFKPGIQGSSPCGSTNFELFSHINKFFMKFLK